MRLALVLFALPLFSQTYDLVIANGRVLDPASNLDAVRHIGIRPGKIAAVSATPPMQVSAMTHSTRLPFG